MSTMTISERMAGYTLIELLVVLAIMGLIAAIATPMAGRAVEIANLKADSRILAGDLRRLQHQAAEQQQPIVISALSDRAQLTLSAGRWSALSDGASENFSTSTKNIFYYPDGTSSGGTIHLSEAGRAVDLNVAWLTGTITLEPGE